MKKHQNHPPHNEPAMPPAPLHVIHHVIVPPPMDLQMHGFHMGNSTEDKVMENGSELEKSAVHAQRNFMRNGITVKDSRAS